MVHPRLAANLSLPKPLACIQEPSLQGRCSGHPDHHCTSSASSSIGLPMQMQILTRETKDSSSSWNGQTMMRSEIIPQKAAGVNLGQGHLYYHFSVSTLATNAPDPSLEHQIAFFEVPPLFPTAPSCSFLKDFLS